MQPLSRRLYTAAQIRAIEGDAIQQRGIPGYALMQRAGQAVTAALMPLLEGDALVRVLCGAGNNGGDGYVVARLLRQAGHRVAVVSLADPALLRGDAALARDAWLAIEGRIERKVAAVAEYDWTVDALLGTGLQRPLDGELLRLVQAINASGRPVVAVDIPTGLSSETGMPLGAAVRAQLTVTFIGYKLGHFIGEGADWCGRILLDDLGAPAVSYVEVASAATLDLPADLRTWLPPRPQVCHKGQFGHVLVVGGFPGTSGAALLAGEAAARVGAGLVSVATHSAHALFAGLTCPVLMLHGVDDADDLDPLLRRASVIALGPGLGQTRWSRTLWQRALDSGKPVVVDADALNLLADCPIRREDCVLTPHPGEAGRLLGVSTAAVQADRMAAAVALQRRFGGVVVLKGAHTLVADSSGVTCAGAGNPGMASGGMGDVLTGVIAGLRAQGLVAGDAARAGVLAHAHAADLAAGAAPRGLLASDLMPYLRQVVNPC
ncbi:MAG: NAD(P)H-hydrate dehydratase [Thiotrichales bacterium]